MELFADRHRKEMSYELGNWVFLKLQPYRMKSFARKLNESLAHDITGPFGSMRSWAIDWLCPLTVSCSQSFMLVD